MKLKIIQSSDSATLNHGEDKTTYLRKKHHDATKLLQLKLNMNDLKANFKNLYQKDQLCEMCKDENKLTNI